LKQASVSIPPVIRGRVDPGNLLIVPDHRHDVEALKDAVVLLAVAKRQSPAAWSRRQE